MIKFTNRLGKLIPFHKVQIFKTFKTFDCPKHVTIYDAGKIQKLFTEETLQN